MKKRKKKVGQTTLPKARRLARAPAWLAAYDGLPENIARNYRKKFHVDILTAIRDLQELGYEFRPGYAEAVEAGEKRRMEQKAAKKLERQEQERMERYPDSDDRFFYIAGYTSGGAPYGVTWEQMGMEPYGDLWEASPEENWKPDEEDGPDDEIFLTRVPLECVPNTLQQEITNVMRAELCEFIDEYGCVPDDKNALYIRESTAFSFGEALSAVLIAYFSRADENYVGGTLKKLETGNTEVAAKILGGLTGAALFKIEPLVPYAVDYNTCIAQAQDDQRHGARPELKAYPDSLDGYDVIYLGYPNYWGTMPMAVYTFLERFDFTGIRIRPFCTHEGSGMGRSEQDIKRLCPHATVEKGLAIRGGKAAQAKETLMTWMND